MKKNFIALALGALCCSNMHCSETSHCKESVPQRKEYVDPQNIRVLKEGIFVLEKGAFVPVETISKDEKGVFVEKYRLIICSKCRFVYDPDKHSACPRCHNPNP